MGVDRHGTSAIEMAQSGKYWVLLYRREKSGCFYNLSFEDSL